jgi:cytochrome c-type biogenesis protein CcmH
MLAELQTDVSRGDSDTIILKAFQAEYGPTVLAAPMFTRFNDVAWIAPPLVLVLGIAASIAVIRKWRLHTVATPETPTSLDFVEILDQIRKETEL